MVMVKLFQRLDFLLVPGQTLDVVDIGTLKPKRGVVCSKYLVGSLRLSFLTFSQKPLTLPDCCTTLFC